LNSPDIVNLDRDFAGSGGAPFSQGCDMLGGDYNFSLGVSGFEHCLLVWAGEPLCADLPAFRFPELDGFRACRCRHTLRSRGSSAVT
jgi:hypothetical protein